ncbi:MAG TPA: hypothetical protein VKB60_09865, partial [Terriglobales bacterium]|nr:hypothetical protein [Terriglobales bacterium]
MHFGLILYGGPDQLMPLTSGLAAAFAFLLIFWNKVMVAIGKIGRLFRVSNQTELTPSPHEESS